MQNTDHNQKNKVQDSPHQVLLSTGFVFFAHVKMKYHQTTYQINRVSLIQPFQGRLSSAGCQKQQRFKCKVFKGHYTTNPKNPSNCPGFVWFDTPQKGSHLMTTGIVPTVPLDGRPRSLSVSNLNGKSNALLDKETQNQLDDVAYDSCILHYVEVGCLPHYLQYSSRFYTSQVVQDFFHQQYCKIHPCRSLE